MERLERGAEMLRLDVPPRDEVREVLTELSRRNGIPDGVARLTLTRGPGGEGLSPEGAGPPTLLVTLSEVSPARREKARRGWWIITARTRRGEGHGVPTSIKSVHKLDAIRAKLEAEAAGADDALLLNARGEVAEGTVCNVFWRRGRALFTPALDTGILPGVTRETFLEIASEMGIPAHRDAFPRSELDRADEIFLTMSSVGGARVRRLDDRELPSTDDDFLPRLDRRYWTRVEEDAR